ncbi:site-specific integrase, partial [Acetobacter sp.]|uniref:site-specific integrase n=1 Tax=Acetobacter sp. TaxID=440 RepID=UPI0039EA1EEC
MKAEDAVQQFLAWMSAERGASAHTIDAYRGDLTRFLAFLTQHHGGEPTLDTLASNTLSDLRAWLAHEQTQSLVPRPGRGNGNRDASPRPRSRGGGARGGLGRFCSGPGGGGTPPAARPGP